MLTGRKKSSKASRKKTARSSSGDSGPATAKTKAVTAKTEAATEPEKPSRAPEPAQETTSPPAPPPEPVKERFGLCKQCKHFEAGRIDRTGRKPMGLCHHGPQHHPHWGTDWCGQFDVQVET